jgi:hypothetical protein
MGDFNIPSLTSLPELRPLLRASDHRPSNRCVSFAGRVWSVGLTGAPRGRLRTLEVS